MDLKVVVPTTLSEINLEQYQRFVRLNGDEEFMTCKVLEIFCNVPIDQLPNVRFKDVSNVLAHVNRMFEEKPSLKLKVTLNGQEFGFVPNLEDMSFGEYVDLDTYLSDHQNFHKAMAVLYRPITDQAGKRYRIEPYESSSKYADLMKQMPMDVAMGSLLFFYRLGNDLLSHILTYLEDPTMSTQLKHSLGSAGVGTRHFISSLKAMLQDLTKLDELGYTKHSPSSYLKSKDSILNESN